MTRHLFTFLATFVVGALVALAARTAAHRPHASAPESPAPAAAVDPHAGHTSNTPTPPAAPAKPETTRAAARPVNTVCAICGMAVDANSVTAEYQGKTIGFGCRMCLPKFKAEPDKYGPYYLRNEVIKR